MKQLNESGLMSHDLDHLVLPLIEIDTFESKIDNARAVVIAFYVFEQEPAKDLERFVEKGDIRVMDSETSPAPTEDGYYVVFIELPRDRNLPEHVVSIVDSVNNLTNIDQWQFKTVNDDEIYDLTEDSLKEHVNLDPETIPPETDELQDEIDDEKEKEELASDEEDTESAEEELGDEEVAESLTDAENELLEALKSILKYGLMESVELEQDNIYLTGPGIKLAYKVSYANQTEPSVPIVGLEIGDPLINESAKLARLLGTTYMVETITNGLLVSSQDGYIILNPLD